MAVNVSFEAVGTMYDAVYNAASCVGGAGLALQEGMSIASEGWHDAKFYMTASKLESIAKKFLRKEQDLRDLAKKLSKLKEKIIEYNRKR